MFDVKSYQHIKELMGHIGAIHSVVASPSGRFLISASIDKTIQVMPSFYFHNIRKIFKYITKIVQYYLELEAMNITLLVSSIC